MGKKVKTLDPENRLMHYTCCMIDVAEALPNIRVGNYAAGNWSGPVTRQPLIMAKYRLQNQEMILFIKWRWCSKS